MIRMFKSSSEMDRTSRTYRSVKNAYRVSVLNRVGKRLTGRHRRTWEYNIEVDLKEIGYDGLDWIRLAQDRYQQ
jgi:hypothetical protein